MPADIGPKDRATHLRVYGLFNCPPSSVMEYGSSVMDREGIRADLIMVLRNREKHKSLTSSLLGYPGEPESGYVFTGIFDHFEIIIKTWPEKGTVHLIIDVTSRDVAKVDKLMQELCTRCKLYFGVGRAKKVKTRLISDIPAHFVDAQIEKPR